MAEEAKVIKTTETAETTDTKFTDEELQSLQQLQQNYQDKQLQFGQLRVQKLLLEQQMDALVERETQLEEEYKATQQEEQDLVNTLNQKYGPGQLDPTTGVFTPQDQ